MKRDLLMNEFSILVNKTNDIDAAMDVLKKVIEADRQSDTGVRAARILRMLSENKEKIKAQREEDAKRMNAEQ